ncbi:hypothetical protein CIHG_00506 [Coccidioides immitis H538.4]|uniref:Uncharacterized protein n=1 Tax=Coccidioides immitis H538.4 TaxID=396776 RepID=A0A0J8RBZ8_COCIT|nr:hypothetical protein CIHG_00506 [Coccidioides immitis H538.4]
MASATGIPEARPASIHENGEEEPLLGRPGDVTQKENQSILINLVTGTAPIAQAGILIVRLWTRNSLGFPLTYADGRLLPLFGLLYSQTSSSSSLLTRFLIPPECSSPHKQSFSSSRHTLLRRKGREH